MVTIHLPPDFKEFFQLLNLNEVKYLVVGGYAVSFHGYPRATGDIDIWIAVHPDNAERIVATLKDFGFESPDLTPEVFLKENQVIRMGIPPLRIELLTSITGVNFNECYANRQIATIESVNVNFIGSSDLKKNKMLSGRTKDQNDLENLP